MSDPFHSSKYSLQHAERRLIEFEREVNAFRKTNPCKYVVEIDSDTMEDVHKAKLVEPIPEILPGCAFDVVSNLRCVLDQACYATARINGTRQAKFPFGMNLAEVQSRANGGAKDIPKEIFDLVVNCKPYLGGNDLLWRLNELCNTNKHETILIMGMGSFTSTETIGSGISPFSIRIPMWDATKNEVEFARTPHGEKLQHDFHFPFFVAIGNMDATVNLPAQRILNNMLRIVNRIFLGIEAEAARIGLFK